MSVTKEMIEMIIEMLLCFSISGFSKNSLDSISMNKNVFTVKSVDKNPLRCELLKFLMLLIQISLKSA